MHEQHTAATEEIERQAQDWVIRLASGQATVAEGNEFRRWCAQSPAHAQAFVECRRMWQGLQAAASELTTDQGAESAPDPVNISRRALLGSALAASAAGLVLLPSWGVWPALQGIRADYRTATGEQREVVIGEGVRLQMNTQTQINLQVQSDVVTGIQLQSGEAEFLLHSEDHILPSVHAGEGYMLASNARFNVRHIGSSVCVTCLEGQVTVRHVHANMVLNESQQLTYDRHGVLPVAVVDPDRVSSWRKRMLIFDNVALKDVIDEVNRYRPGRIILARNSLGEQLVQASLSLERLSDFVTLIQNVYGAEVRQLPGGILLIS